MQWIYFEKKNEFLVHIKYIGIIYSFLLSYNMHIVAMTQLEKFVMFTSSEIAFQNNVLEVEKKTHWNVYKATALNDCVDQRKNWTFFGLYFKIMSYFFIWK